MVGHAHNHSIWKKVILTFLLHRLRFDGILHLAFSAFAICASQTDVLRPVNITINDESFGRGAYMAPTMHG